MRVYESLSSALIELMPVPRPTHLVQGQQITCILCDNFQWCNKSNKLIKLSEILKIPFFWNSNSLEKLFKKT